MNTVIISSSLAKSSKSFILCKEVHKRLQKLNVKSEIIDARNFQLKAYHSIQSKELIHLENKISDADNCIRNFIF
jgi:hypothetical protein